METVDNRILSRYLKAFDSKEIGLWVMNDQHKVVFSNTLFYSDFSVDVRHSSLSDWLGLIHPEDKDSYIEQSKHYLESAGIGQSAKTTARVLNRHGEYRTIEFNVLKDVDELGEFFVGSHRDITEQAWLSGHVERLAYYDVSSGLPNHAKLQLDLGSVRGPVTLIHVHIESMKSLLNQYGEPFVSDVLAKARVIFRGVFDSFKTHYYHNARDTYTLVIEQELSHEQIRQACQSVLTILREGSGRDISINNVYLGAYSHEAFDGTTAARQAAITWSSKTCEYAYERGGEHYAIFDHVIKEKVERYFYVETQLSSAIRRDKLTIDVQPLVCRDTMRIKGFEALSRWNDERLGAISPDEYIKVAEHKGLIGTLGEHILRQACDFLVHYHRQWATKVKMNVNISVLQLLEPGFPSMIQRIVAEYGLQPEDIVLEVTESVILEDKIQAVNEIKMLKALGFYFAMDDYGSGHGSVFNFLRLPFSYLKIDKQFVWEAMTESASFEYLSLLAELCARRGISVTLEGIESQAMIEHFAPMSVSLLQGFHLFKPMNIAQGLALSPDHLTMQCSAV